MSTEKKTKEIEKTDIYQEDLKYLETAVKTAWSRYSGQGKTEKKGVKDLVTDADFAIENYLIGAIRERYPEDSFLTEETNTNERLSGRTWTIDPIDGTINFAYGIPLYGTQISLFDGADLALAMIYLPAFSEMYTAVKGDGAYLNGERIYAAPRPFIESIAASGGFSMSPELLAQQKKLIAVLPEKIMRMRMFGAACAGFAFAAAGRIQCFITATKNKWDICPGILLAREAGCVVSGVDERCDVEGDFIVVGANEKTCDTVCGLLTE